MIYDKNNQKRNDPSISIMIIHSQFSLLFFQCLSVWPNTQQQQQKQKKITEYKIFFFDWKQKFNEILNVVFAESNTLDLITGYGVKRTEQNNLLPQIIFCIQT